jgi:hypothetical protein
MVVQGRVILVSRRFPPHVYNDYPQTISYYSHATRSLRKMGLYKPEANQGERQDMLAAVEMMGLAC